MPVLDSLGGTGVILVQTSVRTRGMEAFQNRQVLVLGSLGRWGSSTDGSVLDSLRGIGSIQYRSVSMLGTWGISSIDQCLYWGHWVATGEFQYRAVSMLGT